MKALTQDQLAKVETNLDKYFELATQEDITSGIEWYKQANKIATSLAKKYNVPAETVASIISALSPRNRWSQNIKDTVSVLNAIHNNLSPDQIKVCTFNKNKIKAFLLAQGKAQITVKSPKTFNFVKNIANLDPAYVTIDVWHLRACFGKTITTTLTQAAYDQLKALTINKATNHGLKGFEYQAIIWNSVKNNFN
jgi:hypothetical protein